MKRKIKNSANVAPISVLMFTILSVMLTFCRPVFADEHRPEYWITSNFLGSWKEPSHLSIAFQRFGTLVCGLVHASAMGVNRLDSSLLLGRITENGIEVYYTSSYYRDDAELGKALLVPRGNVLFWKPLNELPSRSWFWGETTLKRTTKPYMMLTAAELRQCKNAFARREAGNLVGSDLYIEP